MSDPVAPTGVDHIAINVGDVPAGITFYTETWAWCRTTPAPTSASRAPGSTPRTANRSI